MPYKKCRVSRPGLWALWAGILMIGSTPARAAGGSVENRPIGYLTGIGQVWVDHQAAFSGATIFSGDEVATDQDSTAMVNFHSQTMVTISAKSVVAFSNQASRPTLNLREGAVVVSSRGGERLQVNVLGASVIVEGESGFPAISRIASVDGHAAVIADRGRVEVHGAGPPVLVPPGKHVTWSAGQPQIAGQKAGSVSNEIPDESVQHQGQTKEIPLRLSDDVNWEDLVRTLRVGRVRIALLDGSFLNVGARSIMRIVRHDAGAQQTQIELTLGRMRGEVIKLTKPGASFEVRTQTAVIGVVGTIFMIHALPKLTRVFCIDGTVSVRSINAAVAGVVTLNAGEFTTVPRGLPPVGAGRASAARVQSEINQTQVGGPSFTAPGVQPGQAGVASTASTVTNASTAAASATAAGVTGASVSTLGAAQSALTQADSNLRTAQTASNAALSSATAAGNAASNLNTAVQTVIQSASPVFPTSCGCSP